MRLGRWAFLLTTWLLAVGVVATAAWYAIDSAGRQVQLLADPTRNGARASAAAGQDGQDGPGGAGADPADAASGASTPGSTGSTVIPTPAAAPSSDPSSEPTQEPATQPVRPPSRSPSPARVPSRATPSRTAQLPPPARSVTRATEGGSVTITCRAGEPLDYSVKVAQFWSGDVRVRGPQEAEFRFIQRRDRYVVRAECVGNRPQAVVEFRGREDDDDD